MSPHSATAADPLISIVIATMNARETLPATFASLARQTFRDFEIVVADGGSTDGTIELLRQAGDAIAHWQTGPDRGIYDAWNKALRHARGQWLYFMGADDQLADDATLADLAEALADATQRGIRVAYGRVELVGADGRHVLTAGRPWSDVADEFRHANMAIPHQGCFTHRGVFADHGEFDIGYRIAGDYELLLRELATRQALFVPRLVARMANAGVSNSVAGAYQSFREQRRARASHGLEPRSPLGAIKGLAWGALVRAAPLVGEHRVRRVFDLYLRVAGKPPRWTT